MRRASIALCQYLGLTPLTSAEGLTHLDLVPLSIRMMTRLPCYALFFALYIILDPVPTGLGAESAWRPLFNGKDLSGWAAVHDVTAAVDDGSLRIVKGMGWLRTEEKFKDFTLEFEWKALVERYDSGIFFRAALEGKPWPRDGWQVNLRQDMLGALVKGYSTKVKATTPPYPVGEWVKCRIKVQASKVSLTVNGALAWEYSEVDAIEAGFLGIQVENRAFDFRNIRIRPL